jgi:hypothetical protein
MTDWRVTEDWLEDWLLSYYIITDSLIIERDFDLISILIIVWFESLSISPKQLSFKMSSQKSSSEMLRLGHLLAIEAEKLSNGGLTSDKVYEELRKYHNENALKLNLINLFNNDKNRFNTFRFVSFDIYFILYFN